MLIYSLASSGAPDLFRYIGYTKKPLHKRLIEHLSDSKTRRTRKDKWIQKELRMGNSIVANVIEECSSIEEMKKKETGYISIFKAVGARLVNGTRGGDGVIGLVHTDTFKEWNRKTKSKRVYCFDFSTKVLVGVYESVTEMCSTMGLQRSQVGYILAAQGNHSKGYTFSYSDKCPEPIPIVLKPWNKGISSKGMQGFKTTAVIISRGLEYYFFPTVNKACAFLGIKNHSVFCVAMKKNKYKEWDLLALHNAGNFIPGTTFVNI